MLPTRLPAVLCALVAALLAPLPSPAAEPASEVRLSVTDASRMATKALEACAAKGYAVSVAVVDASGLVKAHLRADGAGPHTLESSRRKAFTAASLRAPTAKFAKMVAANPTIAGLANMHDDILLLGGGLPVRRGGRVAGGIGVGGAPGADKDAACATAGLAALAGARK